MFSEELPLNPSEPEEVISHLHKYGSSSVVASAGSRYYGFVIGGSLLASLAPNWISSAWDQNAGLSVTSPVNAAIETLTSNWLTEILPVAQNAIAGFVTLANFSMLAAARHYIVFKA